MFYLFMQTLIWIILAFVLGLIVGWWLRGRSVGDEKEATHSAPITKVAASSVEPVKADSAPPPPSPPPPVAKAPVDVKPDTVSEPAEIAIDEQWRPQAAAGDTKDDLKRIKGVGPVIEKSLNSLGIFTFQQISDFSHDNVKWVDSHINFPGRIDREEWVLQATALAKGDSTEFSARVDKGDVSY